MTAVPGYSTIVFQGALGLEEELGHLRDVDNSPDLHEVMAGVVVLAKAIDVYAHGSVANRVVAEVDTLIVACLIDHTVETHQAGTPDDAYAVVTPPRSESNVAGVYQQLSRATYEQINHALVQGESAIKTFSETMIEAGVLRRAEGSSQYPLRGLFLERFYAPVRRSEESDIALACIAPEGEIRP